MRITRVLLPLSAAALALAACSSGSGESTDADAAAQAEECTYDKTVGGVTVVRAEGGQPELSVAKGAKQPKKLVVVDLCDGEGAAATPSDIVTVDYIGVGYDSRDVFDSSFQRGEPASFPLNGVIPGWTEGVAGMQPGGARLLLIPAASAYGKAGAPPAIGPNEDLAFLVELDAIGEVPAPAGP